MWTDAQRDGRKPAPPNIGGAVCESPVTPLLVPRCKVWLTPTAGVPCSNGNAAHYIRERETWDVVNFAPGKISVGKPRKCIHSVAAHETAKHREVWLASLASDERRRCSNERKTRNPFKLAGVPHVEEILVFNKFFSIVNMCLSYEDTARQSCAMARWRFWRLFLRPVFSASRIQQVSDLHLKFALRPHHVRKYGRHPICGG